MDTNATGATLGSSRLLALTLAGIGAAFAWFLLSLVIGAPSAHASDEDRNPLGSLVSQVTAPVAELTTPILQPVADVVAPVVQPVADVVQPVADTLAPVVDAVTPVTDAVLEPLAPVVAPVTDAVGDVVAPLAPVVAPVIDAVRPVTDAVAPVVDPVIAPLQPAVTPVTTTPAAPSVTTSGHGAAAASTPGSSSADGMTPLAVTPSIAMVAASGSGAVLFVPALTEVIGIAGATSEAASAVFPAGPAAPAPWHPFGPAPDSSVFFSSASSIALGASAVLAFGLLAAHRAWVRRGRPGDDSALPAPILGTDVSPD